MARSDILTVTVFAPLPSELIEMGFLAKPIYYGVTKANLDKIRIIAGDYKLSDLSKAVRETEVRRGPCR